MEYFEFWIILLLTIIILSYYELCKLFTKLFIIEKMLYFERHINSENTLDFYSEAEFVLKRYKNLPLYIRLIIRRDYFEDLIFLINDNISID